MKELTLVNCNWDSNDEIIFTPVYDNWVNENGNTDVLDIEINSKKWNDSLTVTLGLEDMEKIKNLLEDKIKLLKDSGYYD